MMEIRRPSENTASRKLQILLVGPRRTGKSSTGNTLLGGGQVFDTRGGGASAAASAVAGGLHLTVVDARGWGSSEEFVPREEKVEQLRALSLCGREGPHIVLLVIPLLDFTEPERRAVERRMEVFGASVWKHTMVVFTFGDCLKRRARSVEEHIESGGPALRWLMEKCRYRYHVLDNKPAVPGRRGVKQEVNRSSRKPGGTWRSENDKGARRLSAGAEADARTGRELLSKVEDMLQENGGWHFSLHMYQRLEEEWSRRELQLRAWLKAGEAAGSEGGEMEETGVKAKREQKNKLEEGSQRKESKEECEERKINRGEEEEEEEKRVRLELRRMSSEEDVWDSSSDSGGERQEESGLMTEGDMKTGLMAACRPNGGQRSAFHPIGRLS